MLSAVEAWNLNYWPPGNVLVTFLKAEYIGYPFDAGHHLFE